MAKSEDCLIHRSLLKGCVDFCYEEFWYTIPIANATTANAMHYAGSKRFETTENAMINSTSVPRDLAHLARQGPKAQPGTRNRRFRDMPKRCPGAHLIATTLVRAVVLFAVIFLAADEVRVIGVAVVGVDRLVVVRLATCDAVQVFQVAAADALVGSDRDLAAIFHQDHVEIVQVVEVAVVVTESPSGRIVLARLFLAAGTVGRVVVALTRNKSTIRIVFVAVLLLALALAFSLALAFPLGLTMTFGLACSPGLAFATAVDFGSVSIEQLFKVVFGVVKLRS
jgi:hypothetical protein